MTTLITLFNLQEGQSAEEYEQWARTIDIPAIESLDSTNSMRLYRATGPASPEGASANTPLYRYVEVIQVNNMEQFRRDMAGEEMQKVAAAFNRMADNPTRLVCEQFA